MHSENGSSAATIMGLSLVRRLLVAFSLAVFSATISAGTAQAQSEIRIAAVVNDDIISVLDVAARTELIIVSSGMERVDATRQRINNQVMRSLIDETLQIQEAKRLSIEISEDEVSQAFAQVAGNNNLSAEQFEEALRSSGVLPETLRAQIKASLAWSAVVGRRLAAQVSVDEEEIDEAMARIAARPLDPEVRFSEIFLSVDNPAQDGEIRDSIRRLRNQILDGGSFQSVARQFSEAPSAPNGGGVGWTRQAQLPREFGTALDQLDRGEVSLPIRTPLGYYLLRLDNRRSGQRVTGPQYDIVQVFLPVNNPADGAEFAAQESLARSVQESIRGCEDVVRVHRELNLSGSPSLGRLRSGDMAPQIRAVVPSLPVGQPSQPVRFDGGVAVLMVCNILEPTAAGDLPPREEVSGNLRREKIDILARRYLRDLRRAAIVDMRG